MVFETGKFERPKFHCIYILFAVAQTTFGIAVTPTLECTVLTVAELVECHRIIYQNEKG